MFKRYLMGLGALAVGVTLAAPGAASANLIPNGDFESWNAGLPTDWNVIGDPNKTKVVQITGADGTGSAAKLTDGYMIGYAAEKVTGDFQFQIDFLNSGTAGRQFNTSLREEDSIIINVATGASADGRLNVFNGSAWQVVGSNTALVQANTWYRLTIAGTIAGPGNSSYSISLYDLASETELISESGLTAFQHPLTEDRGIGSIQVDRQRSSDFAVDNVSLTSTAVPEPASLALLGLGTGLIAFRRRH